MLAHLIEGVLTKKLGKFIDGLNKQNMSVGIISGNIELLNARLKPDALTQLQLPFKLAHGYVDKLTARVPWTNLNQEAVKVELIGVFIVLEPLNREEWALDETVAVNYKKDLIAAFEEKTSQDFQDPLEELKQRSYIEKMLARIVDNLQVTIKDIHICVEDSAGKSIGLILKQTIIFTTNDQWEEHFADRQKVESVDNAIHKLISLQRFAVYYSEKKGRLLRSAPPHECKDIMRTMIYDENLAFMVEPSKF